MMTALLPSDVCVREISAQPLPRSSSAASSALGANGNTAATSHLATLKSWSTMLSTIHWDMAS
eukprot:13648190-Alexandrium_andersonii.AAC.1